MRLRSLNVPDRMDESAKTLSYLTGIERSSMFRKYIEEGLARDWEQLADKVAKKSNDVSLNRDFTLMNEEESNSLWQKINSVLDKFRNAGSINVISNSRCKG